MMGQLATGNIGIGNTSTLATLSNDRFLIIDDKELYLIGASLKDLGRKCFAFTKLDAGEIRRIKKSAYAKATADKTAFAAAAKAGKSAKTRNAATS